jgi:chromosome segregation ATPase
MSTLEDPLETGHEVDTEGAVTPFVRRAPRISQTDVFRAADELLLEGHRPTIDRVRMRLGRGSPNTINDHLDDWWAKLGSRLRDVPGHEFPQLPERIACTLQQLWNEALDGARETLRDMLREREQALTEGEQALAGRARELTEREHAMAARAAALEESLTLAREQLLAANQRAEVLERSAQERAAEGARLRSRVETLEAECAHERARLDAANAAHHNERAQLQERYAAAESHWLLEVDRARQHAKEAAKEHEQQARELRRRLEALASERDDLRQNLLEARADLKTVAAVREQLEERLRAAEQSATERPAITAKSSKQAHLSNSPRRPKNRRRARAPDTGTSE